MEAYMLLMGCISSLYLIKHLGTGMSDIIARILYLIFLHYLVNPNPRIQLSVRLCDEKTPTTNTLS